MGCPRADRRRATTNVTGTRNDRSAASSARRKREAFISKRGVPLRALCRAQIQYRRETIETSKPRQRCLIHHAKRQSAETVFKRAWRRAPRKRVEFCHTKSVATPCLLLDMDQRTDLGFHGKLHFVSFVFNFRFAFFFPPFSRGFPLCACSYVCVRTCVDVRVCVRVSSNSSSSINLS